MLKQHRLELIAGTITIAAFLLSPMIVKALSMDDFYGLNWFTNSLEPKQHMEERQLKKLEKNLADRATMRELTRTAKGLKYPQSVNAIVSRFGQYTYNSQDYFEYQRGRNVLGFYVESGQVVKWEARG